MNNSNWTAILINFNEVVQTDVTGTCQVKDSFDDTKQHSMTVVKSRDLLSCSNRYGQLSIFSGMAYNLPGVSVFDLIHLLSEKLIRIDWFTEASMWMCKFIFLKDGINIDVQQIRWQFARSWLSDT
jgi:hypothetical protein